MLMFVKAVCAVGLLLEPTESLIHLLTMLEEARVPCRFVLAVMIMDVITCMLMRAAKHVGLFSTVSCGFAMESLLKCFLAAVSISHVFAAVGV